MTRKIDLLLGAALLAGAAVPPAHAAGERPGPAAVAAFAPPEGALLTRELRKDFARGGELVSRRTYAIRFVPEGAGWRVEGNLVDNAVEAPPGVAPELIALERNRADSGLFPLHLDAQGLIVRQAGGSDPANEAATITAAQGFLAGKLPETDRAAAVAMAVALQARARSAGGTWPADLFRPRPGARREVRRLPVGNGSAGTVTITVSAADRADGLLERLERRVVTETAGSRRTSTETWTLALAR